MMNSPTAPSEARKKFSVTVPESILLAIDHFREQGDGTRSEAAQQIFQFAMTALGRSRLFCFHRETWPLVIFDEPRKIAVFEWFPSQDRFLLDLSQKLLGKRNRSEIFRVLTVLYGVERQLLRLASVERLQLTALPHPPLPH